MQVDVKAGPDQIRAIHNLAAVILDLLRSNPEQVGPMPAEAALANANAANAFRDQIAAQWCEAYRVLPEGEEKESLKEEFWFWSDLYEREA